MEFSFDRPNPNTIRNTDSGSAAANAQPTRSPDPVDTSTITNERLRKAIERNRARQAQQAQQNPAPSSVSQQTVQPPPASPFVRPAPVAATTAAAPVQEEAHHQASFLDRPVRETPVQEPPLTEEVASDSPPERPRVMRSSPVSSTVVSRRTVAKPEDTEFVPVKRTTKKVASQISYSTGTSRKKTKSLDPKLSQYLVKGAWVFCGIMVLRLIFASGGVTDFYAQKNQFNERMTQLTDIKKENMQLVREIERMRSDAGFQKKLVRDNLGFIAKDEYLILFPKEN